MLATGLLTMHSTLGTPGWPAFTGISIKDHEQTLPVLPCFINHQSVVHPLSELHHEHPIPMVKAKASCSRKR